jgi:hypothetical protein
LVAALFVYFLATGAVFSTLGIFHSIENWYWHDLHFFTKAALILTEGNPDLLYDPELRTAAANVYTEPTYETFPFPATFGFFFWPLTLLDIETARFIFLAISISAGIGLALLAWRWSGDWLFGTLVLLAQASSFTLYEGLRFNQLAPLVALLLCSALLSLDGGHRVRGSVIVGVIGFKVSIAAAPFGLLLLSRNPRSIIPAAVFGFVIIIGLPYFVVGEEGIIAYLHLLERYRQEAFHLYGTVTAGAGWLLNWNGFVARIIADDPPVWAVVPFSLVTIVLMLLVWRRGNLIESWYAGLLATLLAMPHILFYDWLLVLSVAPFALYRNRSLLLLIFSLALHLSISFDTYMIFNTDTADRFFYTTMPLALMIIGYLAFAPRRVAVSKLRTRAADATRLPAGEPAVIEG